jgi:hypothetical protein
MRAAFYATDGVLAHLAIFSPGAKLPNFRHVLEALFKAVLAFCGYQYNPKSETHPLPRQHCNDRHSPPLAVRIEDQNGGLLYAIQFLPCRTAACCC